MIERSLIHVAGPEGAGKTAFVEALLAGGRTLVLVARCRRDDTLGQAQETAPRSHPELRRYRQAGAIGAALYDFPGRNLPFDDFFMTNLMEHYSQAVLLEGDNPLEFADLRVFVAPPPAEGARLFVRSARPLPGDVRESAAALERLLRDPSGVVGLLDMVGGAPLAELARDNPALMGKVAASLRARAAEAKGSPARKARERWAIAGPYAGIEQAKLVVVNTRHVSDREAAGQLVADLARLRKDEELFADILGPRGNRAPVTAVVADLADRSDPGWKKALARARRVIPSLS